MSVWTPRVGEELVVKHGNLNAFDKYAIAATKVIPVAICCRTPTTGNFKFCTVFDHHRTASIVQCHWCSSSTIITGWRRSSNSYMSDSCCEAVREQHIGHEKIRWVSEWAWKEPAIEMFDEVKTSVIRALVSDESESNMEVDVGKWPFEG